MCLSGSRHLLMRSATHRCAAVVTQRDLYTGRALPLVASQFLRGEQLRNRYSSPFWLDDALLPKLFLRVRPRTHNSRVWVPNAFFPHETEGAAAPAGPHQEAAAASAFSSDAFAAVPLMNASFVEETDLFLFLVLHPLTGEQQSWLNRPPPFVLRDGDRHPCVCPESRSAVWREGGGAHLIHWKGAWETCAPASLGHSWLTSAAACIDAQLRWGRKQGSDQTPSAGSSSSPARRARPADVSRDYLAQLIHPPRNAGTGRPRVRADQVWLDSAAVRQVRLALFSDAFWAPFHWTQSMNTYVGRALRDRGASPFLGRWLMNSDQFMMDETLSDLMERLL